MAIEHRAPIESGCPDGFQYMHPVMRKNYGAWDYHEHPRPGVLLHVAKTGDQIVVLKLVNPKATTDSERAAFETLATRFSDFNPRTRAK